MDKELIGFSDISGGKQNRRTRLVSAVPFRVFATRKRNPRERRQNGMSLKAHNCRGMEKVQLSLGTRARLGRPSTPVKVKWPQIPPQNGRCISGCRRQFNFFLSPPSRSTGGGGSARNSGKVLLAVSFRVVQAFCRSSIID